MAKLKLQFRVQTTGEILTLHGRVGWALQRLVHFGNAGLTALEAPAPRWSGYVHKLREKYKIQIETQLERHGGDFAGRHARYILRSSVEVVPLNCN